MQNRRAMIAKIKIAQKQLDMEDDAYRALLVRVTGKDSCAKMSERELETVLSEMRAKGFVPVSAKHGQKPAARESAKALMGKIEALLADGGLHWNYAHAMAKRMFKVDRVQWLSDEHLHKLAAALQIAANRKQKGTK